MLNSEQQFIINNIVIVQYQFISVQLLLSISEKQNKISTTRINSNFNHKYAFKISVKYLWRSK